MKIGVAGATGRMGQALIQALYHHPVLQLAVALERPENANVGQDAGALSGLVTGILISGNVTDVAQADCLIDFTRPEGTLQHVQACIDHQVNLVIGTTGFSTGELAKIEAATQHIAVVMAPNMSLGVNVTFELLALASRLLGDHAEAEIFELHHSKKVDAPSGTALKMGEVIAQSRGRALQDVAQWQRHGHTGERQTGDIGFSVARGGDVIGDHTAFFLSDGERIEITHRSSSRSTYAQGALAAAQFLQGQRAGLFNMRDVLGVTTGGPAVR